MNRILSIYLFTLKVAAMSLAVAALVGLPMAFFTSRRNFFGRRFILSLSAVPLCLPSLVIALGYVSFFGVNGSFNRFFHTHFSFLYSFTGIVLAQGFYNFPFITGVLTDAWASLPQEQKNAARMLGAGEARVFFTVTIRQLAGALAAACMPVFLFCFFSFMLVMLFSPPGISTMEVEIYHSLRTTLNLAEGAKLAVLETLTTMTIMFLYLQVTKKSHISSSDIDFASYRKNLSLKEMPFLFILLILIALFFLFPFISIFLSGAAKFSEVFSSPTFWRAAKNSLLLGLSTGFCCTLLGFIYSLAVKVSGRQGSALLQTIPMLPMAVSSVVISWLAAVLFHKGSLPLLIFLQTFMYWPLAYRQIQSGINQISPQTVAAARLISRNPLDAVLRLYLPSCLPVLLSAFAFTFATSLGDATMPLILSIRNFDTLALYTYKLAGAYKFAQASACGALIALISMIVVGVVKK
ncbi:MAG: iron ABC transporter permease [Treponema sp.]|nr:iron ABC transporter permease [Treponema sp.]